MEGRIDAKTFTERVDSSSEFVFATIRDVIEKQPQYGANERAKEYSNGDVRYIRITDIDEFGNLKNDDKKTAENIEERYLLSPGDLLFARSGATAGKCFLVPENIEKSIFAGYMIRFVLDKTKILPKYLFYITTTNYYQAWTKTIARAAAQPNINSQEYLDFSFPLPPPEVQQEIVDLMDRAIETKKQLETEADEMLAGVDDWLLRELGIEKGEEKQERKIFTVNYQKIKNIRIDAEFSFNCRGRTSSKDLVRLGDIAFLKAGGTPSRGKPEYWENGTIPWLKSGELKDNLNIQNIEECITDEGLRNSSAKLFPKGTLVIAMYGATTGEVGILGRESATNQAVCSVIPKKEGVLNEYIFWALFLVRKKIKQDAAGGAQPNISKEYLDNLYIPLPPLSEQERIAEHISSIIETAGAKREEAKRVYDESKREVEKMILGN